MKEKKLQYVEHYKPNIIYSYQSTNMIYTDCFQLDGQVSDFYLEPVLVFLQLVGAISCLIGRIFQLSNAGCQLTSDQMHR